MTDVNTLVKKSDDMTTIVLQAELDLQKAKEALVSSSVYQEVNKLERYVSELKETQKEYEQNLLDGMLSNNLKEFKTLDGRKIMVKESPGKVNITNEELLDDMWKKEKVTIQIDKKEILKNLRAGMRVPGAELEVSYKLSIK